MADQAEPLAAHVLPLALAHEVRVPARDAVDAAPGDLLFGDDKTGYVIGYRDALPPVAELEAGDQLGLDRPAHRLGARRGTVIMVGQAADETKADAAVFEEFQSFRRMVDKGGHPGVVEAAAGEKP
jgi:hypothetical protein